MKKGLIILAGASVAALATPAMAQDSTFTGPRAEAVVGYDSIKAGSSRDSDNAGDDQSIEGLGYGVAVGYDIDLGGIVVGPEAEYMGSTAKTTIEGADSESFGFGRVEAGRDLYLGARIGVKASPQTLLYAKGGYTNAKLNTNTSTGGNEVDTDFDLDGYRIGAGAEYAFNANMFAKIEYRYSNYQEAEIDYPDSIPDSDRFEADVDRHQIMAGIGMRF